MQIATLAIKILNKNNEPNRVSAIKVVIFNF
jgi:hypothetical protein